MENSTGSWDLYGQDEKKRYPDLQSKFFTQSADILSRREALRGFVALSEWSIGMRSLHCPALCGAQQAHHTMRRHQEQHAQSGGQ